MPINYQALYNMSVSQDPEQRKLAAQAAKNMTPQEYKEFFNFQTSLHEQQGQGQETRKDRNILGVAPELATLGLPAKAAIGGVNGAINMAKGAASNMGYAAGMGGLAAILHKLGVPSEVITAVTIGSSLGRRGGAAKAEGAALDTEKELIKQKINPVNAGMAARGEKFPPPTPPANYVPKPSPVAAKNVTREPSLSGEAGDVVGGATVVPGFPRGSLDAGKIADPDGLGRALEQELARLKVLKGNGPKMPVGKNADYAGWERAAEAGVPPANTPLDELLARLAQTMGIK